MPILKYIPMNKWTEEEHKISNNLTQHQDFDKCKEELNTLKNTDRFYLLITDEYDRVYLNILTI